MVHFQVGAVDEPLRDVFPLAFGLLARGQVMGFLPEDVSGVVDLDEDLLRRVGANVAAVGVARDAIPLLTADAGEPALRDALERMIEAIDASPRPEAEWETARELLGDDLLARVLGGLSASSLRRYAAGSRATPDDVAWRLHVVARLLASLVGSLNAYGVRRWFDRPRAQLGGRTPADVVRGADGDDDPEIRSVLGLADWLVGPGSAT